MTDVKVGQVRRGPPQEGQYHTPPFMVCWLGERLARIRYIDEREDRLIEAEQVPGCPLWPSEHEQYKNARGYEVKP